MMLFDIFFLLTALLLPVVAHECQIPAGVNGKRPHQLFLICCSKLIIIYKMHTLLRLFARCLIFMLLANTVNAQLPYNSLVFSQPVSTKPKPPGNNTDTGSYPIVSRTAVSVKIMRDFMTSFKNADNIQWYKISDGTMVYFTDNGIKARSAYDNRGKWLYTMRSYDETHLPKEIRTQVKITWYDYTITWVNEITKEQKRLYIVHMKDGKYWKTIGICDGEEMETIEEFSEKE